MDLVEEHAELLAGLGLVSALMLVASVLALPWVLGALPADWFVRPAGARHPGRPPLLGLALALARNLLGWLLVGAGLLMLVLPGQGLLTLGLGIVLLDLPGKRRLEVRILRRPAVRRIVDGLRRRRGVPPFELDWSDSAESSGSLEAQAERRPRK